MASDRQTCRQSTGRNTSLWRHALALSSRLSESRTFFARQLQLVSQTGPHMGTMGGCKGCLAASAHSNPHPTGSTLDPHCTDAAANACMPHAGGGCYSTPCLTCTSGEIQPTAWCCPAQVIELLHSSRSNQAIQFDRNTSTRGRSAARGTPMQQQPCATARRCRSAVQAAGILRVIAGPNMHNSRGLHAPLCKIQQLSALPRVSRHQTILGVQQRALQSADHHPGTVNHRSLDMSQWVTNRENSQR